MGRGVGMVGRDVTGLVAEQWLCGRLCASGCSCVSRMHFIDEANGGAVDAHRCCLWHHMTACIRRLCPRLMALCRCEAST